MIIFKLLRQGYSPKEILFYVLIYVLALSIAFSFHEFMHAVVAYKLGDDTPKSGGRVTLNPLAHIDLRGLILLFLIGIGWGKPVVWNPYKVTKCKPKVAMVLVSLAGVTGNFIIALVGRIILVFCLRFIPNDSMWISLLILFFFYLEELNLMLLVFNLLPIPPLDGFRLIDSILPVRARYSGFYKGFMRYSPNILLGIILLGALADIDLLSGFFNIMETPFRFVIELVAGFLARLIGVS